MRSGVFGAHKEEKMSEELDVNATPIRISSDNVKINFYNCDTCGKSRGIFAMVFRVCDEDNNLPQEEIGKWIKGKDYRICYPCFMKKMGWD